jgi:hypothetical protein
MVETIVVVLSDGSIAPPSDLFSVAQDACLKKLEALFTSSFQDSDVFREYMALYQPTATVLQHFQEAQASAITAPILHLPVYLFARCVAYLGDDMTSLRLVHQQWRDRCTSQWVERVLDSTGGSQLTSLTPPPRHDSDEDKSELSGNDVVCCDDEDPDVAFERFDCNIGSRSGSDDEWQGGRERDGGHADDELFSTPLAFLDD